MFWACRQLLKPLNYLRIRHGHGLFRSKITYDYILPTIFSAFTCLLFTWLDISLKIFEHSELIKRLTNLLALMIAFYVAALAAVATFQREGIDNPLKGDDALLSVRKHDGGEYVDKPLTYRQFISYLFGYLSFLSLWLYIFLALFELAWPKVQKLFEWHFIVEWIISKVIDPAMFFMIFFLVWQLIITSLLGIYFLTERIQSLNDQEE